MTEKQATCVKTPGMSVFGKTRRKGLGTIAATLAVVMTAGAAPLNAHDKAISIRPSPRLERATGELRLVTWNLGYAGLGRESDFVTDGGRRFLPPSRKVVKKNIETTTEILSRQTADIFLLQELAKSGPLTLWHNLLKHVDQALPNMSRAFYPDIKTQLLPPPVRFVHGLGIYSTKVAGSVHLAPLPLDKNDVFPGVKRKYAALVMTLPIDGCAHNWSIINVHLSAFDDAAALRRRQLDAVLELAQQEYSKGNAVVVGGDWNMQLTDTAFPSTTQEQYLFWIHAFPENVLNPGWVLAIDETVPTVRTNERSFQDDENYRTIIDGYILSPNVEIVNIEGVETGFESSDHQPVSLHVKAARCQ